MVLGWYLNLALDFWCTLRPIAHMIHSGATRVNRISQPAGYIALDQLEAEACQWNIKVVFLSTL